MTVNTESPSLSLTEVLDLAEFLVRWTYAEPGPGEHVPRTLLYVAPPGTGRYETPSAREPGSRGDPRSAFFDVIRGELLRPRPCALPVHSIQLRVQESEEGECEQLLQVARHLRERHARRAVWLDVLEYDPQPAIEQWEDDGKVTVASLIGVDSDGVQKLRVGPITRKMDGSRHAEEFEQFELDEPNHPVVRAFRSGLGIRPARAGH